tara:strand:+ start:197 stop:1426 length:1230 start_codon:yes stop_codon:yes gene_type:complete
MDYEVKEEISNLNRTFAAFQDANDRRLKEIEQKGHPDPLLEEQVGRLNAALDKSQAEFKKAKSRLDQIETVMDRTGHGAMDHKGHQEAGRFQLECKANNGVQINQESYSEYKSALRNYIRRNNAGAGVDEIKALSAGSDPDGGYWVTPDISGRITTLMQETSPIRQVANVVTIGTDKLEGVAHIGDTGAGWVGETDARTETTSPVLEQYSIPVHELYAEPRATQRLLDDAMFNVDEWLAAKIAERLSRLENAAFVNGDGTGKPKGFLTYAAGTPSAADFDVIEQLSTGAAGAFAASDPGDSLVNMVFALKARYRENAVFMMKRSSLAAVRKLKDGDGNYLWTPDFQMKQGGTLLGFDVIEAEDMPEIAADSLSIAFGDFNESYQIVDRQGVRILRDNLTAMRWTWLLDH